MELSLRLMYYKLYVKVGYQMVYYEQGSYIIRVRVVVYNKYNIVLKVFKYYYIKFCCKVCNKLESYVLYRL